MRFTTVVELGGTTATGMVVPDEVVQALGGGGRPPVTVTVAGHSYRTTVARMGGRHLVPLAAEHRTAAGVAAGDEVLVDIALDTAERTVDVPSDLAAALDADPEVRRRFDALAYTHRKEHVRAVEEAKAEATRARRVEKVVTALRQA